MRRRLPRAALLALALGLLFGLLYGASDARSSPLVPSTGTTGPAVNREVGR